MKSFILHGAKAACGFVLASLVIGFKANAGGAAELFGPYGPVVVTAVGAGLADFVHNFLKGGN